VTTAVDYSVVKELIREKMDPVVLLEHYGVDIADRNFRYDKVRCACPLHGGDNNTAFSFDLNTKQFTCFTNHCGEQSKDWFFIPKEGNAPRDLFLFIKLMEERNGRKCSWTRALQIGSELTGIPLDATSTAYNKEMSDKLETQKWIRTMAKVNQQIELETFDEGEIEMYQAMLPACDYVNSRGFDDEMLQFFEVGYSPEGVDEPYRTKFNDFPGRIIFPVRGLDGSLVGWSGRLAVDDKTKTIFKKYPKWMHKMDFDKGFVLYNFNNAKPHVRQSMELILVEGAWDVIRLWSYGIKNVVAVMGSSLTPEQLQLAISSALRVKVFLDGDGAGKSGTNRICEQLKKYVDVYTIDAGDKDPDEMTIEEAYQAVNSAKRYI
jgi:5S rRNA maturation endonuclease (ribonuclease M5)